VLRILEGRWKLVILFHLFGGKVRRFSKVAPRDSSGLGRGVPPSTPCWRGSISGTRWRTTRSQRRSWPGASSGGEEQVTRGVSVVMWRRRVCGVRRATEIDS